jgi:NRAMP (natural resistance-associated macrophage protein)-like metal ion transporter
VTESIENIAPLKSKGFVKRRLVGLWALLILMGPGIITSSVDNDAGGIATYSLAGAEFGMQMLWTLVPITLLLIIIQEMVARMAVVSGKGLSDLIRERFGVKFTFYTMILLLVTNLGTTLANFAGIAAALEIFGISRFISVPLSIILLMWLVVKGTYGLVEKVFLTACLFFVAYVVTGFLVKPDWVEVFHAVTTPTVRLETPFLVMLVGLIGTSISPWMLFYLQASMVDKGMGMQDLRAARVDVTVGSIVLSVVAFFIILACSATLFKAGIVVEEASQAALALEPVAGRYCAWLFAFGLFNASMFASSILPLSTAYTVCEAFGWESSLDKKFPEAPQFYGLYCFIILICGIFILVPSLPLVPIMFISQVLNGVALPIVLVFMFLLINDPAVMKTHTNGSVVNALAWIAVAVLFALSAAMIFFTLAGLAGR